MAVRKHLSHDTRTREKIRTSQLINRLEKFVLNESAVDLSPAQVTAALGLIKKTLPDLSAMTLGGDENAPPIQTTTEIRLIGVRPDGHG